MAQDKMASTPDAKRALGVHASAWITGLSYAAGIAVAGPQNLAEAIVNLRPALFIMAAAYVAFIVLVAAIQRHMQKSVSATAFGEPQQLTTTGIFKYSQNPIYAAFLIPLASLACISWAAAAAGILIYIVAMEIFVVRPEAAELKQIFGPDFDTWQAKTPRWFIM